MDSCEKDALMFSCCTELHESTNDINVEEKIEKSEGEEEMSNRSYPLVTLNDEIIFSGNGLSNEVVGSVAGACTSISQAKKIQDVLDDAFTSMASSNDGIVKVSQVIEYMKQLADNANEHESALEELWLMFDDNHENVQIYIDTFQDVMNRWVFQLQQRASNISHNIEENSFNLISFNSRTSSPLASSPIPNRQSSFGIIDPRMLLNCTFGSVEGVGGDVSQLDQIELAAELKEMEYQNKMLLERISKLGNQISVTEENNSVLAEEKEELIKRLSCFQISAKKSKQMEKHNSKLNDKVLKYESANFSLQKKIDELKKENLSLESRIENMKEDLSLAWADLEQAKSLKECLRQELDNLHVEIEQLELKIEIKDAKLLEEVQRSNENEKLIFYWRNKSESSTTEKDRLEMELIKALDNIDWLKRKYKLSIEAQISEIAKSSSENSFDSGSFKEKDGSLCAPKTPLSLRQELESLLSVEDNLPSPFCEKNFHLSDDIEFETDFSVTDVYHSHKIDSRSNRSFRAILSLGEDGDEGVVEGSDEDNIADQHRKTHTEQEKHVSMKWIKEILKALKIILAARREAKSLSIVFQNLKQRTNLRYSEEHKKPFDGFKHGKESNSQFINLKRNENDEANILDTLLEGDETSTNTALNDYQAILGEEFQSTLCETLVNESQNLRQDLHHFNLANLAIDHKPNFSTDSQPHYSNSVWGKCKNLSEIPSATEDLYKHLLSNFELKNMEGTVSLLESQFNKLLLTIFERRKSVQKRLHQHRRQLTLTLENIDYKLKLLFGECSEKYCEEDWYIFKSLLVTLNQEYENFGKVQEEVDMFGFVDKLIQYFEKDRIIFGGNSPKNTTCHASVQCQNIDFPNLDNDVINSNHFGESSSQSSSQVSSGLNRFYRLFNCANTHFCEVAWNKLSSDSSTWCYKFVAVFTVVAFAVICYLLTKACDTCSNCPNNLSNAVYGKTWSEFLKPYVYKQNSPQIF